MRGGTAEGPGEGSRFQISGSEFGRRCEGGEMGEYATGFTEKADGRVVQLMKTGKTAVEWVKNKLSPSSAPAKHVHEVSWSRRGGERKRGGSGRKGEAGEWTEQAQEAGRVGSA